MSQAPSCRVAADGDGAAFLEVQRTIEGDSTVEAAFGVERVDRVYQTELSYPDAVGFFDRAFLGTALSAPRRATTQTTTVWSVPSANCRVARVAVRNTSPTTVEIVMAEAAADAGAPPIR
jgi:hypothetical protein